jgi:hypothetical protein
MVINEPGISRRLSMSTRWRATGWILYATAVAASCGFFGWEPVLIILPVALGIGWLSVHLFSVSLKQYTEYSLKREFAKYYPAADGQIAPRHGDGVPPLLLELGVGARDRLRIASSGANDVPSPVAHRPQPERRIAA